MELHLTIKYPDGKKMSHVLTNTENTIGRDEGTTLRLEDRNVSGQHARIFFYDAKFWCEDGYQGRPSKIGTWIGNKRITDPIPLKPGDRLLIGKYILEVDSIISKLGATEVIPIFQGKSMLTTQDFEKLLNASYGEIGFFGKKASLVIIFVLLILVGFLTARLFYLGSVPSVTVFRPTEKTHEFPAFFSCFALPGKNFTLDAPLSGKAVEIYRQLGDFVRKDDALIQLDNVYEKNRSEQLKAQYEIFKMRLESAENELESMKKNEQSLAEEGNKLQQELEKSNEKEALQQQREKNAQKLKQTREEIVAALKRLSILQKQIEIAQSSYEDALWRLKQKVITSPISGYIKDLPVVVDSYIQQGKPICRITDISLIKLFLQIPKDEFPGWQPKQKIKVVFEQASDYQFLGEVVSINFKSESGQPSFEVVIDVPNPEELVKPGMIGKIGYLQKTTKGGYYIPTPCLLKNGNEHHVFVVKDSICHLKKVVLWEHQPHEKKVLVVSGLSSQDAVVVSPPKELKAKTRVKAMPVENPF